MSEQLSASDQEAAAREVAATAAARSHAESLGVDLSKIGGTGKGGAVTKSDIEAAIAARPSLLSGAAVEAGETGSGELEVEASVSHDPTSGKYLVSIVTRHPDPTVVAVNGKAVWEGVG
jgi:pyruvate/2-oxoglutarate dehydrogenase complex dihydrolipoamide acyltransferase (E2) component